MRARPTASGPTSSGDPTTRDETTAETSPGKVADRKTVVALADDTGSPCCCRSSSDRIQYRRRLLCDSKPDSNHHASRYPTTVLVHNDGRPKTDDEARAGSCNSPPLHANQASCEQSSRLLLHHA